MSAALLGMPVEAVAIGGGGAIVAIVAAAALLRGRRQRARIDTEAAAMDDAAAALPGFVPLAAVVGHDGAAALVSGAGATGDDRLALVRGRGARLLAQEIDWGAVRATAAGIVVEAGERRRGRAGGGVPIAGADALDVRRLAPAASPEAIRVAESLAPPPDVSGVVARTG